MKKFSFAVLLISLVVAMQSCNQDEPIRGINIPPKSILDDSENLGGTYSYVLDTTDFQILVNYGNYYFRDSSNMYHSYDYSHIDSTAEHAPLNYGNLCILLCQPRTGTNVASELQKDHWAQSQFAKYVDKACSELTYTPEEKRTSHQFAPGATARDSIFLKVYSTCRFNIARHTGNISITADKTLFGKAPGTDLSEHFLVRGENACLPQGTLDNFSMIFNYGQKQPRLNAKEFFAKDTWLQEEVVLWLADIPEEQYDHVAFTIKMPATCEYRKKFYREYLTEVPVKEEVFIYRCIVPFGKVSTFEEHFRLYYNTNPKIEWQPYE